MLQSCYGRDDPSVGAMVNNEDQVRREIRRFGPAMARLTVGDTGEWSRTNVSANSSQADARELFCGKLLQAFDSQGICAVLR